MATAGSGWGQGKRGKDSEEISEACAKEEPSKTSRVRTRRLGEREAALTPAGKWYLSLFSKAKQALRVDRDTEGFLRLFPTSLHPTNLLASVRLRKSAV